MPKVITLIKRITHSLKFYIFSGITSIAGMVGTSFLFVRGIKDAIANWKLKNKKGFWFSLLKTIPFILCTAGAVLSFIGGYAIATNNLNTASETISRLSSIAAPAGVAGIPAESVIDKAIEKASSDAKETTETNPTDDKVIEFVDSLSGQHFFSSVFKVNQAVNDFNARLIATTDFMTVNDWYYFIGLNDTIMGNKLGFQIDPNGNGLMRISFNPRMENDKPLTYIVYRVEPIYENTRQY